MLYLLTSNAINSLLNNIVISAADVKDTGIKNAGTEDTYVNGAYTKSICFGNACTWLTSIRGTYIGSFCVASAYIKDVLAYAGDAYTEDAGTKSICIKSVYTRNTCSNSVCTKADTYTGNACIRDAGTDIAGIASTYTRRACTDDAYTGSIYDKSADTEDICGSTYKSSKFFIKSSRLLVKSISKMPISFCLYLQVILDKVLYYRFTH